MIDTLDSNIGITMSKVRDQKTGEIFKRFSISIEGSADKVVYIANNESVAKIYRELRTYSDKISPESSVARTQVDVVIERAPAKMLNGVTFQGWHDDVYITEEWQKGEDQESFCFIHDTSHTRRRKKGSLKQYRRNVVQPSKRSSYLTFALMTGLSGPLLKHAKLSEGAVFHLFGPSTTGKTSCAHIGESISRGPDHLLGWSQTERRMEELAAERYDQLLTMNAAEKARRVHQALVLHVLTHQIAEGEAKGRSRSVHDALPNLTSRSPVLSTGNFSGAEMARACGVDWNKQEEARFISIPVPRGVDGGIIDRSTRPMTDEQNRAKIERIVAAAREDYGVALPIWVMRVHRRWDKVPGYIDEFVSRSGVTDPFKVRIARKFGLVYAAGVIAVKSKFMPWTLDFVFDVVNRLMNRALANVVDEVTPKKVVRALRRATVGKDKLPWLPSDRRLGLGDRSLVGFKYRKRDRPLIALRREALPKLTGLPESSETIIDMLGKAGVLEKGHGGKATQQIPFTLVTPRGREQKSLRMVVVDAKKLSNSSAA